MRPVPLVLCVVALLLTALGGAGAPSLPAATLAGAAQGAANAAGVVIKDPHGGEPKTVCVRFSEDSITGRELLDRAHAQQPDIDPVYSGSEFGATGTAVCALCGEGCDTGNCFCQDRYWNYNVSYQGRWVRSGRGVEQRVITHGDVDGWAFGGDGAAPPYIAFDVICDLEPEPSPTAAAPTATADPTPGPTAPSAPAASTRPSPSASDPTTAPTAAPTPSNSPSPDASPSAEASAVAPTIEPSADATPIVEAAAPDDPDDRGAGWIGGVVFVLLLAALVTLAIRRRVT